MRSRLFSGYTARGGRICLTVNAARADTFGRLTGYTGCAIPRQSQEGVFNDQVIF